MLPALVVTALVGCLMFAMFVGGQFLGDDFVKNTELYKLDSPNGSWQVRAREDDQGALGGNFHLYVNRMYLFGLVKYERQIYLDAFGKRPKVRWLDNRTLAVDDLKLDAATDPELDLYNRGYE